MSEETNVVQEGFITGTKTKRGKRAIRTKDVEKGRRHDNVPKIRGPGRKTYSFRTAGENAPS